MNMWTYLITISAIFIIQIWKSSNTFKEKNALYGEY